jgi:DNA-binding MarR family transcriptional regulator
VTTTPTLNGQVIGLAHYATRALFLRRLATVDTTFEQSIVLNLVAVADGTLPSGEIVERATFSLKVDPEVVLAAIEQLVQRGLATAADEVSLTDAGRELNTRIRAWVGELTEQLYGDLPPDDLAVAARILTTLTERANAELAS